MGKNNKKPKKKKQLPKVSVCTPTFNRRPFIPAMIKCFDNQTYPKDLIEWIIVDDGTDPIGDLVESHPNVKYYSFSEKMSLGKKRNICHEKSTGDILVNMDDDDYYPPTRISHAVNTLQKHPSFLIAGCSILHMIFKHLPEDKQMVQFGPYKVNHGTAATFAFRKELLDQTTYEENAALAEEKHFLKDYQIPLFQLNPEDVILCFSHEHNTFDKKQLLNSVGTPTCNYSDKSVNDFIKEDDLKKFYMEEIDELLNNYEPGLPKHKPDVIEQTKELKKKREDLIYALRPTLTFKAPDGSHLHMNRNQILEKLHNHIKNGEVKHSLSMMNDMLDLIREFQDKRDTTFNITPFA